MRPSMSNSGPYRLPPKKFKPCLSRAKVFHAGEFEFNFSKTCHINYQKRYFLDRYQTWVNSGDVLEWSRNHGACVLKCCTQAYKVHSEATSYNYASCTKCREVRRLSGRNVRLIHWLHKELSYADGRGLSCIWNLWWVSTHHRIHKILNSGYLYPVMADEQLILQVSEKTQRAIFSPLVQKHTQTLPNNSIKLTLAAITS